MHIDFTFVPQLEQSKSKDEVINTFYQAGGQQQVANQPNVVISIAVSDVCMHYSLCYMQRRVDYDIPVELMGKVCQVDDYVHLCCKYSQPRMIAADQVTLFIMSWKIFCILCISHSHSPRC